MDHAKISVRATSTIARAVAVDRACPPLWHYARGALVLTPESDALFYRRWLVNCALIDLRAALAAWAGNETMMQTSVRHQTHRLRRNTRALIVELRQYRSRRGSS